VYSQFIFHEPSAKGKVCKPYYVIKKLLARSTPVIQSDLTPLPARNQKKINFAIRLTRLNWKISLVKVQDMLVVWLNCLRFDGKAFYDSKIVFEK
jgi:hypothetical protein